MARQIARAPRVTRRRFMQACACMAVAGGIGGVAASRELTNRPAPFPDAAVTPAERGAPTPDAPVLLVTSRQAQRPFGPYLAAVLRAEGLPAIRTAALEELEPGLLRQFAAVVLAPAPLTADHAALLEDYVRGGGGLVAVRPDRQIHGLLGVRATGAGSQGGYIRTAAHPLAAGIADATMQIFGDVDALRAEGAEMVAALTGPAGDATGSAAVTINRAGAGWAAAWAYDLGYAIALARQGNPALSGADTDGLAGVRTQDMFVGWVDMERIDVPQADEQQRLLVNVLRAVCAAPLPRLWYFPAGAGAVMVATGDAHGIGAHYIDRGLAHFAAYGAATTIYYATPPLSAAGRVLRRVKWWGRQIPAVGSVFADPYNYPTPTDMGRWRDAGHQIGLHPFVEQGVDAGFNRFWNDFIKLGYGQPAPTVRTHRVLWSGWVESARVQTRYGMRMNLDYYHTGPGMRTRDGEWVYSGYLSGSGQPMPFVSDDGSLLPIYQQHTHLVDEHLLPLFETGLDANLSAEAAVAVSRHTIDVALDTFPTAIGMQSHFDPYAIGAENGAAADAWLAGTLDYAARRRMPVITAESWLAFTEARQEAHIGGVAWDAGVGRLRFELAPGRGAAVSLPVMAPLEHGGRRLRQVLVDGAAAATRERTVAGVRYAELDAPAGRSAIEFQYAA